MTARRLLVVLGLLAIVALVYWPVRQFDFVPLDDPPYVSENPHVTAGLTWDGVVWAFTSRWASYWIPLTWISYMAEVQVFGVDAGVHHVTNVLLHMANTMLLLWWLHRATGAFWRSATVAALFALHPLHVESVAWITERKDVLSTLFLLLTLLIYSAWVAERTAARYAALCLSLVAGLLSKPMLVTVPFLLIACDVWPLGRVSLDVRSADARRRWWPVLGEKWLLALIAIGGAAAVFVTQQRGGAMVASEVFPLGLRVQNAVVSYVIYLRQTLWPTGLAVNYAYPASIPQWHLLGALLVLAAVSLLAARAVRARPYLAMGWLWFLGALVPVIGIVQVGLQPHADRFTYVPLIGLFIAIAWGAGDLAERWRARGAVVAVCLTAVALSAVASNRQVMHWRDGVAMWTRTLAVTPEPRSAQARFDLGATLLRGGHAADAMPHLSAAVRIQPDFAGAHAALGDALAALDRPRDAQAAYETALRLDGTLPEIHNSLGVILARDGLIDAALPHFEAAARLKPDLESARVNLGVVYARLGRREEALRELNAALALNPANAQAKRVIELVGKS